MAGWGRRPASWPAADRPVRRFVAHRPSSGCDNRYKDPFSVVVGVIAWELHIDGCNSLKEKRAVLRSLKDRLRGRHNVSIAETDYQDIWQRAELSAAVVSSDRRRAQEMLSRINSAVESDYRIRIIDSTTILY